MYTRPETRRGRSRGGRHLAALLGVPVVVASLLGASPSSETAAVTVVGERVSAPGQTPVALAEGLGSSVPSCGTTERVSVASDGVQGNWHASSSAISADGRYVAFESRATNLVPNDTNGSQDIFVHDRETGATERVSVASDGSEAEPDDDSANLGSGAISGDGRYVAFVTEAANLVPDDTNGANDVFVHDRKTGTTERVSVASDGTQADFRSLRGSISADGRFVAFMSQATNLVPGVSGTQIYVHDRETGETEIVSVASDGTPGQGSTQWFNNGVDWISADGRYVPFFSDHHNLVSGDVPGSVDAFVHDRQTGLTERVSVASDGTPAESSGTSAYVRVSDDGRFAVFHSDAENLVPNDTNGANDVFVHDRKTGTTERVSVASDGTEAEPAVRGSQAATISADGRYVAFTSAASNLVPNDTNGGDSGSLLFGGDSFVRDRATEITMRVSVGPDCAEGDMTSGGLNEIPTSINADGRSISFPSWASTLDVNDTNGWEDIYVHTLPDLHVAQSLDLGPMLTGQSRSLSVAVTNVSPDGVTVDEISTPSAPFGVSGTCGDAPFTLDAAESCELEVEFSPTAAGSYSDELVLAGDGLDQSYTVNLTGIGSGQPLHFGPSPLDFGGVSAGEPSQPSGVTLTNASPSTVEVDSVSSPSAPFAVNGGTCGNTPFRLDSFASCTLEYTFEPTMVDSFSDVVEVRSDAAGSPHGFTVRGRGLLRDLTLTPNTLDFGVIEVGEASAPQPVTVTNTGDVDARLRDVAAPSGSFTLTDFTCQTILRPGESCTFDYVFRPSMVDKLSTKVSVKHDGRSSPGTVTLRGTGGGFGGGALVFEPDRLDFGDGVPGATTPSQTATLRNTGRVGLSGLSFDTLGDGFGVDTSDCGTQLAPGSSCEVRATFSPSQPGSADTMLAVTSNQDVTAGLGLVGSMTPDDPLVETAKLSADDNAAFGWSAAFSGDTAVVGAPWARIDGGFQGAAYVYVRSDDGWEQQAKLTGSASGQFGCSVAVEGDTILVGSPVGGCAGSINSFSRPPGAAYVFTRVDGEWTEQAKLTASDGTMSDHFGASVALDGDTAVVGAMLAEREQARRGAAHVFNRSNGDWTERAKLTASDGQNYDFFGCSVAVDGETILVGAPGGCPGRPAGREHDGSVYVFTDSGGGWTEQAKLTDPDGEPDLFGHSVALDNDTALIGKPRDNLPGRANVFTRTGDDWRLQRTFSGPDGGLGNDQFGFSVALEDDTALVGASGVAAVPGDFRGAAYVFSRNGGPWSQVARLRASDGPPGRGSSSGGAFGKSVALSEGALLVGVPIASMDGKSAQGAVYVFDPDRSFGDGIGLMVVPRQSSGERWVNVVWRGASSDEVDVFRDGRLLATMPNPGFLQDSVGRRGPARYVYQVCEAGTSRCSNEAITGFPIVRFR